LERNGCSPIVTTLDHDKIISEVADRFAPRPRSPESPDNTAFTTDRREDSSRFAVRNICFGYESRSFVLTNCTADFARGRINILAGRNGSGKSTLAKICAGLLQPNAGQVFWSGNRTSDSHLRERVTLVFQNPEYHFLTDSVIEEFRLTGKLVSPASNS